MTVRLFIARLRQGKAGEWQRVVHQFNIADTTPDQVAALCGASFVPGDLEMLSHISGMPCEGCMARMPNPVEVEDAERVARAVALLEWWLPLNTHTAGTEAVEAIKVLMAAARIAIEGG